MAREFKLGKSKVRMWKSMPSSYPVDKDVELFDWLNSNASKFLDPKDKIEAVKYLSTKGKVLLITTSNRGEYARKDLHDSPKSTRIAEVIQRSLGAHRCTLVDVSKLKIYECEVNVSNNDGNSCGTRVCKVKDPS